jgi:hypothetical protein
LAIDQKLKQQQDVALEQSWLGNIYNALQQKPGACAAWKGAADTYQAIGAEDDLAEVKQAQADANCD